MDMSRVEELYNKIVENLEYVPEELKDEMIDCIVGETNDTIEYYMNPEQICLELLEEHKDNINIMEEVFEYLWDGTWFCRKPMYVQNCSWGIYDFFKQYPGDTEDDVDFMLCQLAECIGGAVYQHKVDLFKPFWIFTDGNDNTTIMQDGDFQDYIIEILKEEGKIQGKDMNRTFIDIADIIKYH